jgi:hypothetical protein
MIQMRQDIEEMTLADGQTISLWDVTARMRTRERQEIEFDHDEW